MKCHSNSGHWKDRLNCVICTSNSQLLGLYVQLLPEAINRVAPASNSRQRTKSKQSFGPRLYFCADQSPYFLHICSQCDLDHKSFSLERSAISSAVFPPFYELLFNRDAVEHCPCRERLPRSQYTSNRPTVWNYIFFLAYRSKYCD